MAKEKDKTKRIKRLKKQLATCIGRTDPEIKDRTKDHKPTGLKTLTRAGRIVHAIETLKHAGK